MDCSGTVATSKRQYITSEQISEAKCGLQGVTFETEQNLKVKFTFTKVAVPSDDDAGNATKIIGTLTADQDGQILIQIDGEEEETAVVSSYHNVHLDLNDDYDTLLLIGFQGKLSHVIIVEKLTI